MDFWGFNIVVGKHNQVKLGLHCKTVYNIICQNIFHEYICF